MNFPSLDQLYQAMSSLAQGINNIGQSLSSLANTITGGDANVTTAVSSMPTVTVQSSDVYPHGATFINGASSDVANATASAGLGGFSGKTTYLTGLYVYAGGATSASFVDLTITGTGSATITIPYFVPAGATTAATPLVFEPKYPLACGTVGGSITASLPGLGAGNTHAAIFVVGFYV